MGQGLYLKLSYLQKRVALAILTKRDLLFHLQNKKKGGTHVKRFLLIFIALCIFSVLISFFGFELRDHNYWNYHGFILLIFLAFFPRLALLLSSIPFGGFFWWIGFFFFPRYLIATLATVNYWHENPLLVTLSWLIALGGESTEKYYIRRRVRYYTKPQKSHDPDIIDVEARDIK